MAPSIHKQLREQGLKYSKEQANDFETAREKILWLWFYGVLNDTQKEKACDKLFTKIKSHVRQMNKTKKS